MVEFYSFSDPSIFNPAYDNEDDPWSFLENSIFNVNTSYEAQSDMFKSDHDYEFEGDTIRTNSDPVLKEEDFVNDKTVSTMNPNYTEDPDQDKEIYNSREKNFARLLCPELEEGRKDFNEEYFCPLDHGLEEEFFPYVAMQPTTRALSPINEEEDLSSPLFPEIEKEYFSNTTSTPTTSPTKEFWSKLFMNPDTMLLEDETVLCITNPNSAEDPDHDKEMYSREKDSAPRRFISTQLPPTSTPTSEEYFGPLYHELEEDYLPHVASSRLPTTRSPTNEEEIFSSPSFLELEKQYFPNITSTQLPAATGPTNEPGGDMKLTSEEFWSQISMNPDMRLFEDETLPPVMCSDITCLDSELPVTTNPTSESRGEKRLKKNTADQEQYNTGRWTEEEHRKFLWGLAKFKKGHWKQIAGHMGSRNHIQVASHAQKYFNGPKAKQGI